MIRQSTTKKVKPKLFEANFKCACLEEKKISFRDPKAFKMLLLHVTCEECGSDYHLGIKRAHKDGQKIFSVRVLTVNLTDEIKSVLKEEKEFQKEAKNEN